MLAHVQHRAAVQLSRLAEVSRARGPRAVGLRWVRAKGSRWRGRCTCGHSKPPASCSRRGAAAQVLTKSHRAMPDKFHGLVDVEKRYRQRYVDLIANPEVKETFRARSIIVSTLRRFLEDQGFLEIETPVRSRLLVSADAVL